MNIFTDFYILFILPARVWALERVNIHNFIKCFNVEYLRAGVGWGFG